MYCESQKFDVIGAGQQPDVVDLRYAQREELQRMGNSVSELPDRETCRIQPNRAHTRRVELLQRRPFILRVRRRENSFAPHLALFALLPNFLKTQRPEFFRALSDFVIALICTLKDFAGRIENAVKHKPEKQ